MSDRTETLYERTESTYKEAFRRLAKGKRYQGYEPDTFIDESVMDTTHTITIKIELSTGGPADWVEVEVEKESWGLAIVNVTHVSQDWDEPERHTTVREGEGLYLLAERCVGRYAID